MTVDSSGDYVTYISGTWLATPGTVSSGDDILSVSCTSGSFCAAGDDAPSSSASTFNWNGSSWTAHSLATTKPVNGMSCGISSFCEGVDSGGNAILWNGTSWSASNIESSSLGAVSCYSNSFCGAGDVNDDVIMYSSNNWQVTSTNNGNYNINAISCSGQTTTLFCAAADAHDNVLTITNKGDVWNWTVTSESNLFNSVSCVNASFCMAVGNSTSGLKWSGSPPSWSTKSPSDTGNNLTGVSCVSSTYCWAVDNNGNAVEYTGSWGTVQSGADGTRDMTGVSCANSGSTYVCWAVDASGYVVEYSSGSWQTSSASQIDTSAGLVSVSCPTISFCEAVDSAGNAYQWSSGSWSSQGDIDSSTNDLSSVSCSGTGFCEAVDTSGRVVTYSSGSWSGTIDSLGFFNLYSVSCPNLDACAAGGNGGQAFSLDTSDWGWPEPIT